ncbi:uncharacterized protein [Cherax quadricarinatus]
MTSLSLPRCSSNDESQAEDSSHVCVDVHVHQTQAGHPHPARGWTGESVPSREREFRVVSQGAVDECEVRGGGKEVENEVKIEDVRQERSSDPPPNPNINNDYHTLGHLAADINPGIYCLKLQHSRFHEPQRCDDTSDSSIFPGDANQAPDISLCCKDRLRPHHHCIPQGGSCTLTTYRRQDCNNNLKKGKISIHCKEPAIELVTIKETVQASHRPTKRQHMIFKHALWKTASRKLLHRRKAFVKAINKTFSQLKSFYQRYKYTIRGKTQWNNSLHSGQDMKPVRDAKIQLCNGQTVSDKQARDGGMRSGRQRGDQSPGSQGTRWWQTNGSNSEKGNDNRRSRVHHTDTVRKSDTQASTISSSNSTLQRSFDLDGVSRRKRNKSLHSMRRSVSIEQDRSDDVYLKTIKYRDKSLDRRAWAYVSSSSEDPATGLQATLRARPTKHVERKRPSPTRRTEVTARRPAGEHSRSRRRLVKKTEQSSSSPSSSSSRSASATRAKTAHRLRTAAPSRFKKKTQAATDVVHTEDSLQLESTHEGNSKDNTKEFLERLDSVLSDLVENEKKKISKYGHSSVKKDQPESELVNSQPRKKLYKKRDVSKEKVRKPPVDDTTSPSLQQLRETLKTVRVKKRTPSSGDVLEKYPQRFTNRQPHNPRILRSQRSSQLVSQGYYQPPRRRLPRPRPSEYPSDFYSSDDEQREVEHVCQGSLEPESLEETEPEVREDSQPKTGENIEDEDTCYGSDYQGSQALQHPLGSAPHDLAGPTTHRLLEAADSGDFSVDSAYTGSRGATPEGILNPGFKPRRQSSNFTSPLVTTKHRQPRCVRRLPQVGPLQQLKRTILNEIRESKLYSDESINSLLDQYRHKCCHLSPSDLDIVTRSVQDDLGVKPRPAQYLYQILVGGDDDQTQSVAADKSIGDAEDTSLLTLQSTGKTYMYERRRRREVGVPWRPHSSTSRYAHHIHTKTLTTHRPRRSQEETEDEAWAREAVGVVAPGLVRQAREEAQQRLDDDPEADWSHYVAQLCQQLEIKM